MRSLKVELREYGDPDIIRTDNKIVMLTIRRDSCVDKPVCVWNKR